jgi:hypothetical protein
MAFSIRLHFCIQDLEGTAALAATNTNNGMHQNTVFKIYKIRDKLPRTAPAKAGNNLPPYRSIIFHILRLILRLIQRLFLRLIWGLLGYVSIFIQFALSFFLLFFLPCQFFLTLFKRKMGFRHIVTSQAVGFDSDEKEFGQDYFKAQNLVIPDRTGANSKETKGHPSL